MSSLEKGITFGGVKETKATGREEGREIDGEGVMQIIKDEDKKLAVSIERGTYVE